MAKKSLAQKSTSPSPKSALLVVGIGAAAGGVPAIRKIFAHLHECENVAFVVIPHLNEAGAYLAQGELAHQSPSNVFEIKNGLKLKAGNIYHSPPHTNVSLKEGVFQIEPTSQTSDNFAVIDRFLFSLSKDQGPRAVAIILSGGGTDGSLGLKAISDAGGMTIVQSSESAEFSSMPESAIATGSVDHILSPGQMPSEIASYAKYLSRLFRGDMSAKMQEKIKSSLPDICDILLKTTKHDFKHYKSSTLARRIQHRMQVLQMFEVSDYVDRLRVDAKESESLFKELLINVTSFFRDPGTFETLKTDVLAKALTGRKSDQKYRVGVAGCSTGEEAYTLAILLREVLTKIKNPPEIQIIATDIDEQALAVARKGSYPITISENVSAARLKRFFVKKAGRYIVGKEIRECVLFSAHNLITDPPFSQLDLISCRNVIIYMGPHLQKKLIPVFHYALRPSGYLLLGSSESLATHKELFRTVSTKNRIGQRKATAIRSPGFSRAVPQTYVSPAHESARSHDAEIHLISQRIVLDEFTPRYAVVNDDCQIVSVSAGIAQYLDPSEGSFQNNLLKLVKPSLRVGLRSTFNAAKKQKRQIKHEDSTLKLETGLARIGITVQPMPQLGDETSLFMVVFHDLGTLRGNDSKVKPSSHMTDTSVVEQLERELTILRGDLDRSIQDLEASNEELKSSNEELLSMNEELQSANEELETSKEDVQNINEALQRTNTDLENLMTSTEIATLFLDSDLRILSFTPQTESIYNISKVDIGRPVTDITDLALVMPLIPTAREVLASPGPIEAEIEMKDGRWVLRRISPYKTSEGSYSGIVVTFIDVTHLRAAEAQYRDLANSMPHMLWTAKPNGHLDYFNERWYEFTDFERGRGGDAAWTPIVHPDDLDRALKAWYNAVRTGANYEIEYRFWDRRSSSYRWFIGRASPIKDADGRVTKWYGSSVDIHDRVMAEEMRRETEERFQIMADTAPVLIWMSGPDKKCTWFNKGWVEWTGRPMEDDLGEGWTEGVHPQDLPNVYKVYSENFEADREFYVELRMRHSSGEQRWISSRGVPRFTPDGSFAGFIGGCVEIDTQKKAQEQLIFNEERMSKMIQTSPSFMCLISAQDFIFEEANERYLQLVGHRDILGKRVIDALPEVIGQGFLESAERVRETGQSFIGNEMPIFLQRQPGAPMEKRYLDFVYQPDRSPDGKVERIFVHGTDVTEKVHARAVIEKAKTMIENERQNFRKLFKQTPEMVCILSGPKHTFEFVNEAHVRALGFDATGMDVRVAQPESVEIHGILDHVYSTGITAELKEIPITVTDRLRYFNLTYAARYNIEGEIDGVMILGAEISNEVTNRMELQQAKDAAEMAGLAAAAANESKTQFLANMSHEIRTPLAAILGFTDLLRGKTLPGDADAEKQLDRIARNASQLGRLIDELLDLSKIEADRLEVELTAFDLSAALEEVFSNVSLMTQQKGLVFKKHLKNDVPPFISTDPTRFKQILLNVIGNAVKFTEKGSVEVELEMRHEQGQDFLEVCVSDTGIGLSPEHQAKIFEPFMQADASVTRKYGGTGLGLVLSRRLAKLLGGDLRLRESHLGQGSQFLIRIAVDIPNDKPATASVTSVPSDPKLPLEGRKVLVVDDSPDNQTIISLFISRVGASVEIANNGLEAVGKMKATQYDVVLMDIQMPVMDGYQALKVANQSGYRGPILALTAHAMKEEKERCLAAGFSDYLSKPIDRMLLVTKISNLIQL